MEFTASNWRDIEKYYHGTYLKFQEFGDRLFLINNVRPAYVKGIDEDQNEFILYLDDEHPYTVDYILPNKAVFSYRNAAFLLQRVPARQYRRGLCEENVKVVRVHDGQTLPFSFEVLKAFVQKQKYLSLKEALASKSGTSFPLTSRISYYRKNQGIYVDTKQVAYISNGILLSHRLFEKEMTGLIQQDPFEMEIRYV